MLSPLKSYGISVLLHASVAAALFAIPSAVTERFVSMGQRQVISIEATQGPPLSMSATPLDSRLLVERTDSLADRAVKDPLSSPRPTSDVLNAPQRPELPRVASPPEITGMATEAQVSIRRKRFDDRPLELNEQALPPRTTPPRPVKPPVAIAVPTRQWVGLEEVASADLSNNSPPAYPLEAIRRRLEGVVLLELRIGKTGKVEDVELIESSGHRVLDDAAIQSVARWQGKPAKKWGRAIESIERLPIRFRL